ncbi:MAG: PQQ-binding-like beta-propeller repeat protein [Planctomycetia bacterium]|nr:PQQ-binding-like beta-propeller repeat protein [Planctomycetia bacterium]
MRTVVLFLTGLLTAVSTTAAENWPRFRGPDGEGRSAETGLALTWSETEHVAWKTAIHGKGWSSPVIWDNQIWMTTAPEDGKQLFAVCVDRHSGRVVHDIRVFEIAQPQYCIPMNSYASPTPVVEEGRVYVHFGAHGTACLDTRSGKILWTRQDLPCNHFRGPASSPIVYGNLLVVAYDGFDLQYVVALDKKTGKTVWRRDRNIDYGTEDGDAKKAYGTARVIEVKGKPQLVYPSAGATIAYVPQTGEEIWRVRHGGMNANATPMFGNGRLYLNTASGGFKLFAMRVGGVGDVTDTNVEWKCSQGVPSRSSELLIGDLIFMTCEAGIASCLDAHTGKAIRQQRLKGEFSSSPLHADGRVYSSNQDGSTFVLSADRQFKLLATNQLDAGCMASPAVYDKALYLRTKTHLYRIQK